MYRLLQPTNCKTTGQTETLVGWRERTPSKSVVRFGPVRYSAPPQKLGGGAQKNKKKTNF